jgi:hypothetical protein
MDGGGYIAKIQDSVLLISVTTNSWRHTLTFENGLYYVKLRSAFTQEGASQVHASSYILR